jgi:hypothetical protein
VTKARGLRRAVGYGTILLLAIATLLAVWQHTRVKNVRHALFEALTPVTLANCELARFGDANDGGYLLCGNLLNVQAAYSYGINGTDNWGCQVSRQLAIATHQYDCFNTEVPACAGGDTRFNAACVGAESRVVDGRPFGTMREHITKNGDSGKRLVVKMDVEGSEWSSLVQAPDDVLDHVDQLAVEFHGVEQAAFLRTIARLKETFYVANVHHNNFGCEPGLDPFPGEIFEVLFVSKRIAKVDPAPRATRHAALDAPNAAWLPDCQAVTAETSSSEFVLFRRWVRRVFRRLFYESAFVSAVTLAGNGHRRRQENDRAFVEPTLMQHLRDFRKFAAEK